MGHDVSSVFCLTGFYHPSKTAARSGAFSGSGKEKVENQTQGEFLTETLLAQLKKEALNDEIACFAQGEGTLALIAQALLAGDREKAYQLYYSPPDLFSEIAQKMAWNWLTMNSKTVQSDTNFNFLKIEIAKKGNDLH